MKHKADNLWDEVGAHFPLIAVPPIRNMIDGDLAVDVPIIAIVKRVTRTPETNH